MLNQLRDVFASFQRRDVKYVVSRENLIASKCAVGREVDLEDVNLLELGGKLTRI